MFVDSKAFGYFIYDPGFLLVCEIACSSACLSISIFQKGVGIRCSFLNSEVIVAHLMCNTLTSSNKITNYVALLYCCFLMLHLFRRSGHTDEKVSCANGSDLLNSR